MKNLETLLHLKKQVEDNRLFTEIRIDDLKNEIETAKSDLAEKITNFNQEKLRVKQLNLSKTAIANRIESINFDITEAKEDTALVIRDYNQDIADEKKDLKRYAKELLKLAGQIETLTNNKP